MPSKTSRKRLARAAQKILARPVPEHAIKAALEHFQSTGLLPDDQRLGAAVLSRIRHRIEIVRYPGGDIDWGASIDSAFANKPREKDDYMDGLIQEALFAGGLVRAAAREALVALVSAGFDVTSALFADRELPEFGSVGFELLGLPERLARRPYVRQTRRLLQRLGALRRELPQHDRIWFENLGRAVECFQHHGERPQEPRMLEALLIIGELHASLQNAGGEDTRHLLVLFDSIATTDGDVRDQHIERLVEIAREGEVSAQDG